MGLKPRSAPAASAQRIGNLVGMQAQLTLLAVDAALARAWDPFSDYDAVQAIVDSAAFKQAAAFAMPVGDGFGRVFTVGDVGTGSCDVYRAGDRVILIEPEADYCASQWPDAFDGDPHAAFAELARSPLADREILGDLVVTSGLLAVGDMWDAYASSSARIDAMLARSSRDIVNIGDETQGLAIPVTPGRYDVARGIYSLGGHDIGAIQLEPAG